LILLLGKPTGQRVSAHSRAGKDPFASNSLFVFDVFVVFLELDIELGAVLAVNIRAGELHSGDCALEDCTQEGEGI